MSAVEKWKSKGKLMANATLRIHTAKFGAIEVTGKVDSLTDLPRLFAKGSEAIKKAVQVMPDVAASDVERITFTNGERAARRAHKSSGEAHAATA
jgi:hypothetical protein